MATGTVKWYNALRGYGFIAPEGGARDVYVHVLDLEQTGLTTLRDGERVSYEIVTGGDGREAAANVRTA